MPTSRRVVPAFIALMVLVGGCGDSRSISELREDQWANAVCDATLTLMREVPTDQALARYAETLADLDPPESTSAELRQDFDVVRDGAAALSAPRTSTTGPPGETIPNSPQAFYDPLGQFLDLTLDHYVEIPALWPPYDPHHLAGEPYDTPCHEYVARTGGHRGNPEMLDD